MHPRRGLHERGVEAFILLEQRQEHPHNPARCLDPRQPVPEGLWPQLPRYSRTKNLHRAAFVYELEANCYHPLGHRLCFPRVQASSGRRGTERRCRCGSGPRWVLRGPR